MEATKQDQQTELAIQFKKTMDEALRAAHKQIAKTAEDHIDKTIAYADKLVAELVDAAKEEISSVKSATLKVKVGDKKEIKLSCPASPILADLISAASVGVHCLVKGPAGSGKTTAAKQASEALELPFYRFVFSPDMGTSALFGRQTVSGFVDSVIVKAAKSGGVLLLDEMDAASSDLLMSINGLTDDSGEIANPITGETIKIHEDLFVVACCNTWGLGADHVYVGRQRLDGASLDRFVPLELDYSADLEKSIAKSFTKDLSLLEKLWSARIKLKEAECSEILSTRSIERLHRLVYVAGWAESKAIESMIKPWSESARKASGLV